MRLRHALVLTHMLWVFFLRRVLSAGALRAPTVRVLLGAGAALLAILCTTAAYLFLRPVASDRDVWQLVLQTSTISALLWTQCAFLFVKILFLNSEKLLELSFHLPLTGRERAVGVLVYEATMVMLVAGAGFFSVCAAAVLVLGLGAVQLLLQTIVIPVLLTYALLSVVHVLVLRVLARTKVRRVAHLLAILVVFGLLLLYARQLGPLVSSTSQRYLDGDTSFSVLTAPTWLADRWGALALVAVGGVVVSALVGAVLALTPRQYVRPSRYLRVWPGASVRALLTPYDRCLLRGSQTWLAGLAALGVFVALCLRPAVNPLWAASLLSMGGLYLFAATEPLRAAGWDRGSPLMVYARLLRAQLLLVAGGIVSGLLVVAALVPAALSGAGPAVGGSVLAVVLATFIGVMFPAEHDNPFSVFIGLSSTAMVGFVAAAALGILRLEPSVLAAVLCLLTAAIAAYTVIGIRLNEQGRRHEKVVGGPQQRGGRLAAHRRDRCGDLALSHVLDR